MAALARVADERTSTRLHGELSALYAPHATSVDEGGLFAGSVELAAIAHGRRQM